MSWSSDITALCEEIRVRAARIIGFVEYMEGAVQRGDMQTIRLNRLHTHNLCTQIQAIVFQIEELENDEAK